MYICTVIHTHTHTCIHTIHALIHVIPLFIEISTHWPDEQKPKPRVDISTLPSAPRSSTAPNIDVSRLPKSPPFTVFIGNLSYEATEEDVRRFFERNQLQVRK